MKTIVAATRNKHKIEEIEAITREFGMNIISRDEAGVPHVEVEENGRTFEENSYIKAYEIMKLCGQITIADDSGLEVDCLGGAPGVYSARFASFEGLKPSEDDLGDGDSSDSQNNQKLKALIEGVPLEDRGARFVSVITLVYPDGRKIVARGEVEGHIIPEEKGEGGFGYDPMFVPIGYDESFGQLGADVKNAISHRAQALKVLRDKLEKREFEETV